MTSKLSFRSRALDATKPLPIYHDSEIPDTADCSNINRTVPQMPTGMEKEEESEHHLQRAICAGITIPTPEVFTIEDLSYYSMMYPANYKTPRQLIYMQPFSMEPDIPDYDMDSEDEQWIHSQSNKLELTPDKFEEMMDRLEKGSGQTVVTLQEAKALIKEDDDLIIAVYDYWLNKRLKTQHHLIPQVRTEARYGVSNHNPYIAFRRRTEKMQTRKNRKNDESSYEKMLKLRRDLVRAVNLLDMVKRREKSKRELLHLSIEVFERRYSCGDYTGSIIEDALSQRPARPSFTPLYPNNQMSWIKDETAFLDSLNKKVKRQYKKRRHKSGSKGTIGPYPPGSDSAYLPGGDYIHDGDVSSDDDTQNRASPSDGEDEDSESSFTFRRRLNCDYYPPVNTSRSPTTTRCSSMEEGTGDNLYNFCPTSISKKFGQGYRFVGNSRRRIGRGGRVILDRNTTFGANDFWRSMGYSVFDSAERENSSSSNESPSCSPTTEHGTSNLLPGSSISSTPGSSSTMKYSHYKPKSLPTPPPEESNGDSDDEDEVSEQMPISDSDSEYSKPNNRLGLLLGATVCRGDQPMLFNVGNLVKDTYSFTGYSPGFLGEKSELSGPSETFLLDKSSATTCNSHFIEAARKEQEDQQDEEMDFNSYASIDNLSLPFNFDLETSTSATVGSADLQSSSVPVNTLENESEIINPRNTNIVLATIIEDSSSLPPQGSILTTGTPTIVTLVEEPQSSTLASESEPMETDTTPPNSHPPNLKISGNGCPNGPSPPTIIHVVNGVGVELDNTLNSQLVANKVENHQNLVPSTSAAVPTTSKHRSAVPTDGCGSNEEEAIVAIVENVNTGGMSMDQTSDCSTIVDETQKPNFLLASKTWVTCNCIT